MVNSFIDVIRADIRHSAEAQDGLVALGCLVGAWGGHMPLNRRLNHVICVQGAVVRVEHSLARVPLLDTVLQTVSPA